VTPSSTAVVPRLISVAEIIKREYLKQLREKQPSRLSGLHQYNEIHCLEDTGTQVDTGEDTNDIVAALEGKNLCVGTTCALNDDKRLLRHQPKAKANSCHDGHSLYRAPGTSRSKGGNVSVFIIIGDRVDEVIPDIRLL